MSSMRPPGTQDGGHERPAHGENPVDAMRRIREELDALQASLTNKDARLHEKEESLHAASIALESKQKELAIAAEQLAGQRAELDRKQAEVEKQESFVARARELERTLQLRETSLVDRERAMRRTLQELKRQAHDLERQRREHRRVVLKDHPAVSPRPVERRPSWRIPAVVLAAALAGLLVFAFVRPAYRVQMAWEHSRGGVLSLDVVRDAFVRGTAHSGIESLAAIVADNRDTRWWQDSPQRVTLECRTRDPAALSRSLNTIGADLTAALAASGLPVTRPAGEIARLAQRRDELRAELSLASTRAAVEPPASEVPTLASVEAMLARVDELASARRTAKAELAAIRSALTEVATRPVQADPAVVESLRTAAQTKDAILTQARRRLREQQEAVRSLLRDATGGVPPAINRCTRALEEMLTGVAAAMQSPPDEAAADELAAIRAEGIQLKEGLAGLSKAVHATANALQETADPLAEQQKIEAVVKEYAAASETRLASLARRVQAIGEGGVQITKRLVVRAALAKDQRQVGDSHREVMERAKMTVAAANFRLEAAVRAAAGAHETIAARTAVIDSALAGEASARAAQERDRRTKELQPQEQALAARVSELTDALIPAEAALQELTRRLVRTLDLRERRYDAEQRRLATREEIARIETRLAALQEPATPAPDVRFVSASYSPTPANQGVRIAWGLLTFVEILVVGLLAGNAAIRAWLGQRVARLRSRPDP